MREALFWEALEGERVRCDLCPHHCVIEPGKRGICGVRSNEEGVLIPLSYGKVTSLAMDPIEKKPLYHFCPGSSILSVGSYGCNLSCDFCQNYAIAKGQPAFRQMIPEELVQVALSVEGNGAIAFTYNEPLMAFEYVYDTARLAQAQGLRVVLVTNGFVEKEPLDLLLPYIDAMNIDLKAFNDAFYTQICKGQRQGVLETIARVVGKTHVELTTLLIQGENTDREELEAMFRWIAGLDPAIPLHLSRYFPSYKRTDPPTPEATLDQAVKWGRQQLDYVYAGNMQTDRNTYCPQCQGVVIERSLTGTHKHVERGHCPHCGTFIALVDDE